jgi:demethylmenaquinone methyltransferase/2-methoxy-6-polyprenyl-1,4-benzoquinol methylase
MPTQEEHENLLDEQIAYYRARAGEYDEWYYRWGRYDRGPRLNAQWFDEVAMVREALRQFNPQGRALELACGTGLWTEQLLQHAAQVTALDVVPEILALNRDRVGTERVRHVLADVFDWHPSECYDVVFFAFWLSHVPPERFKQFWGKVAWVLEPWGRVFFVDSRFDPTSTAKDHGLDDPQATIVTRRLNDGREFRVVKIFYEADAVTQKLAELGWHFEIRETPNYFLYGEGRRRDSC